VVGYAGGFTPNPTYEEVCSGLTGHTEVVLVVFDKDKVSYRELLAMFWELHNPTQGMRQGNDVGTQYRSAIYCTSPEQLEQAKASRDAFQAELSKAGSAKSPPKSIRHRRCISPRPTTSSTLPRTRTAIAASAVPACACHPACKVTEA
jgi:methionine-S-sulfoxide reductase